MIAATLEQKLEKLDEALEQYRKLTWGRSAPQARAAVARLTEPGTRARREVELAGGETPA